MVFKKKKMVAAVMVFCMVLSLVMGEWKPKKAQADDIFQEVYVTNITRPAEIDGLVALDQGIAYQASDNKSREKFTLSERGWLIVWSYASYNSSDLYANASLTKLLGQMPSNPKGRQSVFYLDAGTYYIADGNSNRTVFMYFIPTSSVMKSRLENTESGTKVLVDFMIERASAKIVNEKYSIDKNQDRFWDNSTFMINNSYITNSAGDFTIRGEFGSEEWKNFPVMINLTLDGKSQNTAIPSTAPANTSKPDNNGNSSTNTGNNSVDSSSPGNSGTEETANPSGQNTGENPGSEVTDFSGEDDIEKISLKETSLELTVGDEHEIKFTTTPSDAEADDLEWMSSNEDVAEVDDYGKITAVSAGKAKITVQTEDGEVSASLSVIVKPEATQFTSVKTSKKKIALKWERVNGVSGYQIQYSTSKAFKGAASKTEKAKSTTSNIKNLKSKKMYYLRIRTYQTISGKKYYSAWSSVGSIKVK